MEFVVDGFDNTIRLHFGIHFSLKLNTNKLFFLNTFKCDAFLGSQMYYEKYIL